MYTNSRVQIADFNDEEIQKFLEIYKFVGYQRLIIDFSYKLGINFNKKLEIMKKLTNLELFGRITFKPNSMSQIKKELSNYNNIKDFIIGIESSNKDILTFAANDSRIDIISFPGLKYIKELTPGLFSLLKQNNKFFDISLNDVISKRKYERSKAFREIHKLLNLTKNKEKIFLFGGGETEPRYIRGPKEIISILHSILDLSLSDSRKILRETPSTLINRINNRNNLDYIEPDIKIVNIKKK